MLENFIYSKQKSLFEEALNNGEVLDEAIVFIEDTKEIWNHGTYFDGSTINLKTINGESILGEGDITIEGGSGAYAGAYAEVNHGTSDTTFTLTPNTFHVWDEVASLDLSFGEETSGVANEYLFQFTSGATATTLTLPSDIKWANEPTIAENKIYQISVLKGLASVLEFGYSSSLFPVTLVIGTTNQTNMDVYNYLYTTYGEVTTAITEELYFERGGAEIPVNNIEYGTYEGLTGYWLNGYSMMNLKQVLTSDGAFTQLYPTNIEN